MAYNRGGYGPPTYPTSWQAGPQQSPMQMMQQQQRLQENPLVSAGGYNVMGSGHNMYAGNATKSQITAANFGGSQPDFYEPSAAHRFAGQSTRSSITVANFGGDPSIGFPSRSLSQSYSQPAGFSSYDGMPHQQQASQYYSRTTPYRQEQPPPLYMASESHIPQFHDHNISPISSPKLGVSPAVEKMIREIAELRVRNGELEDYVRILENRLSKYESV